MSKLHIAAVTGSRADFGLMTAVYQAIRRDARFMFSLVVTGAHLDASHGHTVNEIEAAGFEVAARVPATDAGDDAAAVARATACGLAGFAGVLAHMQPDLILLPGDRYEILAAAIAALFAKVPVAHFFGGDVTAGAFDDAIRHSISKVAHIHFPTNTDAAKRLAQLGEDPDQIHMVGSPGLDVLAGFTPLDRSQFFSEVGLEPRARLLLVSFHPETLDLVSSIDHLEELLAALEVEDQDAAILLTGSNADTEGRALSKRLQEFAAAAPGRAFRVSLGHRLYSNALAHAAAVIGNSSSGLYEAPSFRVPAVNIGDRQKGRLRAASVIDCTPQRAAIAAAIGRARRLDCTNVVNPYGDGHATERIMAVLGGIGDPRRLLKKSFRDVTVR
jgi:UDP-hydrolysing UDP-N-acetyl-D-glucosamine 2-epimerase